MCETQQCLNDLTGIIILLISASSAMEHLKCGKRNRGKGVATFEDYLLEGRRSQSDTSSLGAGIPQWLERRTRD